MILNGLGVLIMKDINNEYKYYRQQVNNFKYKNGGKAHLYGWDDLEWLSVYNDPDNFEVVKDSE